MITRFTTEWLGNTLRGFKFEEKEIYFVLRDVASCLGRFDSKELERMKKLSIELWGENSIKVKNSSELGITSCDTKKLNNNNPIKSFDMDNPMTSCQMVQSNTNYILVSEEGAKSIVLQFKPHEPKKKYEGWEIDYENKRETWRKFNRFVIELIKKYEREYSTDVLRELSKTNTNTFRDRLVDLRGNAKEMGACQGHINTIVNELFELKGLTKKDESYEMLEVRNNVEDSYIKYLKMFDSKSMAYNFTRAEYGLNMKKKISMK